MLKRLVILVITLIVIFWGAYYLFALKPNVKNTYSFEHQDIHTESLYQAVGNSNYIAQGNTIAKHKVYVIFDPNCKFCHAFFEASQKFIQNDMLAIRWVPIGIIKPSSPTKTMAILSAKSPIDALKENENQFDYSKEEGGIKPVADPNDMQIEQFNHNMRVLKGLINSVPVIVYKNDLGYARISGGALLPLEAKSSALAQNEQKVENFIKQVSSDW
ncbi:hypothetical protein [Fastidiosibacter lacustris]|uniref:hypothetical protein n=1 Tax=Fastidiosibacter lacustris TaxID=2056695 RepID=UPI000E3515A3|nr:hypothetical protein [Fastidiosibacter lacustris]